MSGACVRACVHACMCTPSPYRLPANAISVDKRPYSYCLPIKVLGPVMGESFCTPGGSEGCAEEESKISQ